MAKQLNVDLNLRANTQQAKQSIQDLQNKLSQIANMPINGPDKLRQGLQEASAAAQQLQMHIANATNVDTGRLDMSKFSQSLKKSNADLTQLTSKILSVGTTGQQAFVSLANSLAQADRHALSLGTKLGGLMTTLKNTARWQISSSILHGFMGTIQSAYGYAQDLNKSLNNIRIVTGKSTEEMAAFADQANKAAKALSTSTLNYTDAALIYYQQGIRDQKEIEERTTTTIKLANVSRQSAEEVSSEMTAIWNNFAKGGQNLEYYADVITALGAATASSSQEIASGLQKFAAVADTVGLSYEKASAALATVVATTRQSEDVVGTALKTIFARVDSLKLGETLDDGVSLNKYAKALQTVGVSILDSNQNLKDMDTILNDLGNKWQNISEAQRVALAETVAGQRQYAQFMALMNNYDKVLQNEDIAKNAEGTLQAQQDIYAESWEAASKRVKASLQSVYHDLLDDKFFISLSNGFAQIIDGLHSFIEGLGGIKPLLIGIGGFVLSSISGKITPAIQSIGLNIKHMFMSSKAQAEEYTQKMNQVFAAAETQSGLKIDQLDPNAQVAIQSAQQLADAKNRYMLVEKELTPVEKQQANIQLQLIEAYQQEAQALADKQVSLSKEIDDILTLNSNEEILTKTEKERANGLNELKSKLEEVIIASIDNTTPQAVAKSNAQMKSLKEEIAQYQEYTDLAKTSQNELINTLLSSVDAIEQEKNGIQSLKSDSVDISNAFSEFRTQIEQVGTSFSSSGNLSQAQTSLNAIRKAVEATKFESQDLETAFQKALSTSSPDQFQRHLTHIIATMKKLKVPTEQVEQVLRKLGAGKTYDKLKAKSKELADTTEKTSKIQQALNNAVLNFNPKHIITGTEAFAKLASVGMQVSMVINSIKSAINAITDKDMSPIERITTILMSVGMAAPAALGALSSLSKLIVPLAAQTELLAVAKGKDVLLTKSQIATNLKSVITDEAVVALGKAKIATSRAKKAATMAEIITDKLGLTTEQQQLLTSELVNKAEEKGTALTLKDIVATTAKVMVDGAETGGLWAKFAAWIAVHTAMTPVMAATAALILLIGGAVAAIALLVIGIKALVNWYNKDAIAAKQAAANAKAMADASKEAADRAQQLKEAFNKYDTVVEKLNQCKKGTQEWRDALAEVNSTVLDILTQFPELVGQLEVTRGKNGELILNNTDEILAQAEATAERLKVTTVFANAEAEQASVVSKATNVYRDFKYDEYTGNGYADIAAQEKNKQIAAITDSFKNNTYDKYLDDAGVLKTEEELKDLVGTLGMTDQTFHEFYNSLKQLTTEANKAANSMSVASKLVTDNVLKDKYNNLGADNSEELNTSVKNAIVTSTSRQYDSLYQDIYKQFKEDSNKYTQSDSRSDLEANADSIWHRYLKAIGHDNDSSYSLASNAIRGSDTNRTYHFTVNGEDRSIGYQEMASIVASYEASQKLGDKSKGVADAFSKMNADTQAFAADIINSLDANDNYHLTTGLERFSQDTLKQFMENKDYRELGFSDEDLKLIAESMGWSVKKLKKWMPEGAKIVSELWDELDLNGSEFQQAGIDNISLSIAQSLNSQFKNIALGPLGEEAGQQWLDGLNNMLASVDPKDREAALEALSNIDWTSYDALDQADKILQQFNGDIDIGSKEWKEYAEQMRIAAGAFPDFSSLKTNLQQISKILQSLDFGSTISQEDYQTLINYNDAWKEYFQVQADGSKRFIGNAENMKQATIENIESLKQELDEDRVLQDSWTKANWHDLETGEKDTPETVREAASTWSIKGLKNAVNSTSFGNIFKDLGYKTEDLLSWIDNKDIDENAKASLEEAFGRVADFLARNIDAENEELNEMIAATASSFAELQKMLTEGTISEAAFEKQSIFLAKSATSLNELQSITSAGVITNQTYFEGLMTLASKYENASDEAKKFQEALVYGSEAEVKAAKDALELAVAIGEASEKYGLEAKNVETQAKIIQNASNGEMSGTTAARLAIRNQRTNKGVASINKDLTTWAKTLSTANVKSTEFAEALNNTYEALADLTGALDATKIPLDFLNKRSKDGVSVLKLMKQAAQGNTKAIDELGIMLAQAQIELLDFEDNVQAMTDKDGNEIQILDEAGFEDTKQQILNGITDLYNQLDTLQEGQTIGDILSDDWIAAMNTMAQATQMSVEEMNATLNELGVDVEVKSETFYHKIQKPIYRTHTQDVNDGTNDTETVTWVSGYQDVTEAFQVAQINAGDKIGKSPKFVGSSGAGGISTSSTSPSSSSKSSKTSTKQVNDETERYYVVEKRTNSLSKAYDRLSRAKDQAFGANRLAIMDEELDILQQQLDTAKEYEAEARAYLQEDYNNLVNGKANGFEVDGTWYNTLGAASYGLGVELDDKGNIANYDELIAAAIARYNSVVATGDETAIKIAEKQLESFKDLINQYSETNEKLDDQIAATEEAQVAIYQAQFENWQTKLELKITINANDKRRIEYELMKLGDDVYKTAEMVSLMFSPDKESQLTNAIQNLKNYRTAYADLEKQLKNGQITEEAFNEGIEQLKDGMYENLELLFDLSAQAKEYYTNTLSDLTDKVKEVTESMAHNLGVLDHLQNLLTLTGHGTDYKALGGLLEASEQISKQQYEASQAQYDYALDQQAKRKKEYDDAVRSGGAKEIEIAAENLKAANKLVEDTENEMLEKAAAYAQAIKNTIANTITATYSELENELTNGLGFDFLKEQMDLDEKIEERNYTKTNQLYETQKMSRKLQQDIDKTTNAAAKQRLASFQQEIDLMSQKNTLSKSELELAQARYDLLLAQIALEEAQNAKTTVRLQRDAEGNYGYVYTADQSKIAEAEQNVADKENALYNKAREIENSVSKELINAQEEYLAKVRAIDEDEVLSTKEKTERKQKLEEQYKEYITNLTTERTGALKTLEKTSATNVNDTWTAKYKDIVDQQATAHTKIHNKLGELNITLYGEDGKSGMFGKLQHSIDDILGPGLEKLASKTQAIKDKNDDLLKTLTGPGGLIQKNTDTADTAAKGTLAFGKMWDKLMNKNTGLIPAIEELIKKMDEYIKKGNTTVTTKHKIVEERVGADGKTTSAVVADNQTGGIGDPESIPPSTPPDKDTINKIKTGSKTASSSKQENQLIKLGRSQLRSINGIDYFKIPDSAGIIDGYNYVLARQVLNYGNNKGEYTEISLKDLQDLTRYAYIYDPTQKKYIFVTTDERGKGGGSHVTTNFAALMDTGGYTGRWYHSSDDPMMSGKLAMLHEKELVLNQEDTKNFLASIEMVRDLARVIDLQAAAVGMRQQLEARFGFDAAQGELAQNIVIHADFPNATDHNEIMEAFETLADRAAQYANRADRIMTQAQENYNKAKLAL